MKRNLLSIILFLLFTFQLFAQQSNHTLLQQARQHFARHKDTASLFLKQAIEQARAAQDTVAFFEASLLKSRLLQNIGNMEAALRTNQELLKQAKQHGNRHYEARCLLELGENERAMSFLDASMEYLHDALAIYKSLHDQSGMANTYNRMAATLYEMQAFNKALAYADSSNKLTRIAEADPALFGSNYVIIGGVYEDRGSDKAMDYFQKALHIYQEHAPRHLPNVYYNIMLYYQMKSMPRQAITTGEKALAISQKSNNLIYEEYIGAYLSKLYAELGLYKKALYYNDSVYIKARLKRYHQTKNELSAYYRQEFEAEKRDNQIMLQQKQLEKNKLQQKYYLTSIVVLLLIFATGLFTYLKIERQNRQLKKHRAHIEIQQKQIMQQNRALQATNEKLHKADQLRQDLTNMVVHDLKNPLHVVLNLADNDYVKQAGNIMHNLIMNLLDLGKNEQLGIAPETAPCNVQDIASQAITQVQLLAEHKHVDLQNNIPKNLYVDADEDLLTRIFVNLLSNAIKYSKANLPVLLDARSFKEKEEGSYAEIAVTDYGPGISTERQALIFERYQGDGRSEKHITSTGLGLSFCKMAIEAQKGSIQVDSEKDRFTRLRFTLPLAQGTPPDFDT